MSDHEVHLAPPDPAPALATLVTEYSDAFVEEVRDELGALLPDVNDRLTPAVQALIARCMEGTEPMLRELKPWEPKRLNGMHVMILLMASAGFRGKYIAEALGFYDSVRVSIIMRHPYGRKILHALFTQQGGILLDLKSKLESYGYSLIDKVYDEAQESKDLQTVAKIGFALLDRAGYAPAAAQAVAAPTTSVTVVVDQRDRLANALEESRQVDAMVMPSRKQAALPLEAQPQLKAVG